MARFDAATDRVSHSTSPPDPSVAFSIGGWAKIVVDRDDFSTFARFWSSAGASTTVTIATGSSGQTPCVFSPGNTGGIIGGITPTVGQWFMWGLTVTGTTGTLYLRLPGGSTISSSGNVSGGSAPTGFTLGGRHSGDSTEWFNGSERYNRIWSAVLTQVELEAEWDSASPIRTSGLWADYVFLDASDLIDHSGNGRNLVAGSTAVSADSDDPPIGISGSLAAILPALTTTMAGTATAGGLITAPLPAMVAAIAGTATTAGLVGINLPGLQAALSDIVGNATIQVELPKIMGLLPAIDAELLYQRELTREFIASSPVEIALVPRSETRMASGGVMLSDLPARPVQRFRLIPMSHTERPQGSNSAAQSRDAGVQRQHDYTLLGEWNSQMSENDWWQTADGQRLVIDSLVSYNGYQQKAMITSRGRRPRHVR